MELSRLYAGKVAEALTGAVDARKVAEAWAALHPKDFTAKGGAGQDSNPGPQGRPSSGTSAPHGQATKALDPAMSAFLARWAAAIRDALRRVLGRLWPEAWTLGQQAAQALAADLPEVDWAGWAPGDYEAALQVAEGGLEWLLGQQDVQIKSIASSQLELLGNVLAEFIASESVSRPLLPADLPPEYSVGALADALEGVLANPSRALMVAHTEVARASVAAGRDVFSRMGIQLEEVSTAGDTRVCPACDAAAKRGALPVGTIRLPLHPICRCAPIPVIPAGQALAALGGVLS